MSEQRPSVSVIVRAYNEDAHIGKLLRGIAAQRVQPSEVILVDSGSTDRTVEIAESAGAKIVRIAKREFTFGRALNVGCAAATGDILVFVSAHVYPVHDTWLEQIIAPFEDSRVALCYGRQLGDTTNKFSEHQLFRRWFPTEPAFPQDGYFCNNANCAVRRSIWQRLRYDETLTGLEDLDWAKRAQAEGGWLIYEPEAAIVHVHDESWSQVRNRYRREAMALRRIDDHSQITFLDFMRFFVSNALADAGAALRQGRLRRELKSIVAFRFNQFFGAWRGQNDPPEASRALRERFYYPVDSEKHAPEEREPNGRRIDYARLSPETDRPL